MAAVLIADTVVAGAHNVAEQQRRRLELVAHDLAFEADDRDLWTAGTEVDGEHV